ncbi:MAG: glycosyl hydrolase 53 family protein [Prevotella sp.]|nr:glycosyl hydrolase 53 family protein [Prevotella sp.]
MRKISVLLTTLLLTSLTTLHAQKYVGGDISMLPKYEDAGVTYKDKDGNTVDDVIAFFKQEGQNTMRVRLFVDPSKDNDKAVCQDLDYVKKLGKRIKDAGLKFMLDFHYSDTWADPAKQWTPDAWKSMTDAELNSEIYSYTKDCLQQLKAAGAEPDFIQTGNEISYGMLWGTEAAVKNNKTNRCFTDSPEANWTRFTTLLTEAGKACREICPDAKIIIHSERTPKSDVLTDFFDRMKNASLDYDIIGLSYYPAYHGNLGALETALKTLEDKDYGKDIWIVETGYSYAWAINGDATGKEKDFDYTATYPYTEEGQRQFTADLITKLNAHSNVKGLLWWWPEDNGNKNVTSKWWNAALYNHDTGKPYAAFYELKNFAANASGISSISSEGQETNEGWYSLNGSKLEGKPQQKGIYINKGEKLIVK